MLVALRLSSRHKLKPNMTPPPRVLWSETWPNDNDDTPRDASVGSSSDLGPPSRKHARPTSATPKFKAQPRPAVDPTDKDIDEKLIGVARRAVTLGPFGVDEKLGFEKELKDAAEEVCITVNNLMQKKSMHEEEINFKLLIKRNDSYASHATLVFDQLVNSTLFKNTLDEEGPFESRVGSHRPI